MKRIVFIITTALLIHVAALGQILTPVKRSYGSKKINDLQAVVFLKASIPEGWHIYARQVPEKDPTRTRFSFDCSTVYALKGTTRARQPATKKDPTVGIEVGYYPSSAVLQQGIKLADPAPTVTGTLTYMACNDRQCLRPEDVEFTIPLK